jgi:membrane fusion protein, multidrug efflux system
LKRAAWVFLAVMAVLGLAVPKVWPKLTQVTHAPDRPAERNGKGGVQKVAIFEAGVEAFVESISATGTLRAEEGVELQAETSGKIVAITFSEGAAVRKGALLLKLNDADLRANLERYIYGAQLAAARERRYATLLAQRVVTQQDYDATLGELNVQKANVDLYRAEIGKTEVRAPFDGVVGLRYVSTGAFVNAATRIATLQRVERLKVDFAIPEKYTGRVKVGSSISFSVAGGLRTFVGRIYAIDPRIDSGTRTILLRATCDNPDGSLLPGAFANVSLPLDRIADAVLIPAEAVIPGLEEKNVYVVKSGVAERRAVETGARTATQVHILSGIAAGDKVITSGLQNLKQGQAVEVLVAMPTIKP